MNTVTEAVIDDLIEYYESVPETLLNKTTSYMEKFPPLLAYLEQESNDVLLEDERDIQWYIVVVCLSAMYEAEIEVQGFTVERLTTFEEKNWELMQSVKSKDFKERLNPFFDSYPQEDLLAFVEDMIQEDDDSPITAVGREVIFVTAKSIIDAVIL